MQMQRSSFAHTIAVRAYYQPNYCDHQSSLIFTFIPLQTKISKESKLVVEEKFAETAEYLRRPNVLYPPFHNDTGPTNHYHTLPSNPHHYHHVHHHVPPPPHPPPPPPPPPPRMYPGDMFGPGSYHTIAHYQLYKRPCGRGLDYCSAAAPPDYYRNQCLSMEQHDFVKTLGRTRRESPMANKAPLKLKKLIKSKKLMPPAPVHHNHHPHFHHHGLHHHHAPSTSLNEDHMKMLTWSPYSSHMLYNEPHHHSAANVAGKSLDELRF